MVRILPAALIINIEVMPERRPRRQNDFDSPAVYNLMIYNSMYCDVEAECHFCYLSDSSVYVHESSCLGVQRHLPTYESRSGFQDGPETNVVSVLRNMYSVKIFFRQ